MFFFSSTFYIITVILQAICVIHCIRKGNQNNWIWLIVFLPMIGCIIYLFSEIITKREIKSVTSGVTGIINPSASVKKLEENLKFSDTFNNRVALADALLAAGQTAKAIDLYEGSLNGAFTENEHVISRLVMAYYREKRYEEVISMAKKIYTKPQFSRSKAHVLYAMSQAYSGNNDMAEKEFLLMKARFSNFEARYYYSLFLQMNNRMEESKKVLTEIIEEIPQLGRTEKKYYREWLLHSKELLKKTQ